MVHYPNCGAMHSPQEVFMLMTFLLVECLFPKEVKNDFLGKKRNYRYILCIYPKLFSHYNL